MAWIRKRLRGSRVWVRSDGAGNPVAEDGRADVLYQLKGKIYRAAVRNLEPDDDPTVLSDEEAAPSGLAEKTPTPTAGTPRPGAGGGNGNGGSRPAGRGHIANGAVAGHGRGEVPADAVHIYTDGACTGNPGPMGIGVVVLSNGNGRSELSEYLGIGTNNIAELTAILRGLEVAPREKTVVVYSDSSYALGLLGKGWKAKANAELVERIRRLVKEFRDLRLVKVAGHAGVPENERCDELARGAVLRRR